ncbi:hypothetical protein HDR58_08850 [bacterium]|nr:hypothetical protein [bacterium]
MKITIKYLDKVQNFENKQTITIGKINCDFCIDDLPENTLIKMVYSDKYKNYVLVNSTNNNDILLNNKPFSKILVPSNFALNMKDLHDSISITSVTAVTASKTSPQQVQTSVNTQNNTLQTTNQDDLFNNDIETNRVAIIKEIGYKITELKNNIRSMNITSLILHAAMFVLSIVCAFGMTNFLLGLKIDNSQSVLNLTTNAGFLVGLSIIVLAIAIILKLGVYSLMEFKQSKKYGDTDFIQKSMIGISMISMFIFYIINLFYYKDVPGFAAAAFFIALLFVGALTIVSVASGYFQFQIKTYNSQLTNCEYREDFESVMKSYRGLINTFVNKLSQNRINTIKGNLLNNQLKMIVEMFIGLLTAPFLAYGVSNTLASCFPEAANWVRISGLRFSPIFLVLASFLIIFAFFSFVRAFTISKQIKGSEIIKFDGFHDYNNHGVTVLGLDSMRSLNKEKNIVMFIACFIILIEFTMNVSYFITEIGGDLQGMFLSFVTALVPTALLIAETHLLSSTMYKINNYNELLAMLD